MLVSGWLFLEWRAHSKNDAKVHIERSALWDTFALRATLPDKTRQSTTEARWGDGVVKQFAFDMREAFPEASGFSHSNVKYMKQWYLFYYQQFEKSQRPVDLFENMDECSQLKKANH